MTSSPATPRRRLTEAQRAKMQKEVVKLYARKLSIRDISTRLGRSYGSVHNMLVAADVKFRPRGGATRKRPSRS